MISIAWALVAFAPLAAVSAGFFAMGRLLLLRLLRSYHSTGPRPRAATSDSGARPWTERCARCKLESCRPGRQKIERRRARAAMSVIVVRVQCPCGGTLEGTPSGQGTLACGACGRLVVVDASAAARATPGDG